MTKHPIADRKAELDFFLRMLAGTTRERILLIQAASGWGKTDLLHRFAHESADQAIVVRVDLRATEKGIADVFRIFREMLGIEALTRFENALANLVETPSVNIADNKVLGQLQIEVALNVDEQTRKLRLVLLEEAFFQDLAALGKKIVVILDTFEKASPELEKWLCGPFLRAAFRNPSMFVIVGGQRVPESSVEEWEDYCARHPLKEIDDIDAWHEYAQEIHLPFERDAVKVIVLKCEGNPAQIRSWFDSLAPRWEK